MPISFLKNNGFKVLPNIEFSFKLTLISSSRSEMTLSSLSFSVLYSQLSLSKFALEELASEKES